MYQWQVGDLINGIFVFKVMPSVSGSILTLSAPGMMSMSIDLSRIKGKGFRVAVWGQPVSASDCGEEAARWLSRFILQEDTGFRLVYYPLQYPTREVRSKNKIFLVTADDTVSSTSIQSQCSLSIIKVDHGWNDLLPNVTIVTY